MTIINDSDFFNVQSLFCESLNTVPHIIIFIVINKLLALLFTVLTKCNQISLL